jgi:sugar phosphate isomerase/epimerase
MNTARRHFLKQTLILGSAGLAASTLPNAFLLGDNAPSDKVKLGMVTYLWGQNWDLPTLLDNCAKTQMQGVELRTQHKHGVEPSLSEQQRREVKKRFDDSPVKLVGCGSTECFDHPDPEKLKLAIEATKTFVKLGHDCGGSGVKVRPNDFHPAVPREKTIEQIGRSLNVVGKFADDYGQDIRLEVHGSCCELPTMKAIMDFVTEKNVGLCWNCNGQDFKGKGLASNFSLVEDRLGKTTHIRELTIADYPYQELFNLLVKNRYQGWMLLECASKPKDYLAALNAQREAFYNFLAKARGGDG